MCVLLCDFVAFIRIGQKTVSWVLEQNALYKVNIVSYEEGYKVMGISIYDVRWPLTKMAARRFTMIVTPSIYEVLPIPPQYHPVLRSLSEARFCVDYVYIFSWVDSSD